jgi:hypothetical protein
VGLFPHAFYLLNPPATVFSQEKYFRKFSRLPLTNEKAVNRKTGGANPKLPTRLDRRFGANLSPEFHCSGGL